MGPAPASLRRWAPWILLLCMALAAVLRFHHPGLHWLSHDEVYTALRTAGYATSAGDLQALASGSGTLTAQQLQRYLQLSADHGWADTLRELAGHPEHPPLYFLLARMVRETFGDSMARVRQLSGLFSLLVMPAVFWLAREVSGSTGTATVAAGTLALSPLQLLQAQDARPYSLLVLLTALACAAYLQLRRSPGLLLGCAYGLILLAGLYTSLLFLLVPLSQGLHALVLKHPAGHRRRWAVATTAAFVAFLPWAGVMRAQRSALLQHTDWLRQAPATLPVTRIRSLHWSAPYLDLGDPSPPWWPFIVLPLLLGLTIAGAIQLVRQGPSRGGSLLVVLLLVNGLALELADLLLGGQHALVTRYLLPGLLSVRILVATAIWSLLSCRRGRAAGVGLLAALLLAGAVSCGSILSAETWWSRYPLHQPSVLRHFLRSYPGSELVVVASPTSLGEVISLSQRLPPETRIHFAAHFLPSHTGRVAYMNQMGQVITPHTEDPGRTKPEAEAPGFESHNRSSAGSAPEMAA